MLTFIFKFPITPVNIISPILSICLISFLCYKKFYTAANIIIGILILLNIILFIFEFSHGKFMTTLSNLQSAKASGSPDIAEFKQQFNQENQQLKQEIENKIKNYV